MTTWLAHQIINAEIWDHFLTWQGVHVCFVKNINGADRRPNCYFCRCIALIVWWVGGWCWHGAESLICGWLKPHLMSARFHSRMGDAGSVQDFIFLFLIWIKGMRRPIEFKIFLCGPMEGKILLRSFMSCWK